MAKAKVEKIRVKADFLTVQQRALGLVVRDESRDKLLQGVDKMIRCDWDIPQNLETKQWMAPVIETAPRDASETAGKALGSTEPIISMQPVSLDADSKETANKVAKVLKWEFRQMNKRNTHRIVTDITRSAVRYDTVCGRLIYLPYQLDESKMSAKSKKNKKRQMRNGKFSLKMYHPQSVHARSSIYGLEEILLAYQTTARDVLSMYPGAEGKELNKEISNNETGRDIDVCYYQYTTIDERWAWWTVGTDVQNVFASDRQKLVQEENKLPFIDWVYREGGTDLDLETEYRINPLLASIYRSGQWELINTVSTIYTSEAISYAASPRWLVEGPDGKSFELDYGDPAKIAYVQTGYKVSPIQPPKIDRALTEIYDRTKAKIDAGTMVQNLGNPNFPSGTAFAAINALLQTTLASLTPKRKLAESALEDIFEQMLLWVDYRDDILEGWGSGKEEGDQVSVSKMDFSTEAIYIDVKLNATAPTEKQQRINNAAMLIQQGLDKAFVLKELGIEDYEEHVKARMKDMLRENEIQIAMKKRQFEAELEMQNAAQNATQPTEPPPAGGDGSPLPQGSAQEPVSGQGYNPALSGQPAQIANPEATRELQRGEDISGEEIA